MTDMYDLEDVAARGAVLLHVILAAMAVGATGALRESVHHALTAAPSSSAAGAAPAAPRSIRDDLHSLLKHAQEEHSKTRTVSKFVSSLAPFFERIRDALAGALPVGCAATPVLPTTLSLVNSTGVLMVLMRAFRMRYSKGALGFNTDALESDTVRSFSCVVLDLRPLLRELLDTNLGRPHHTASDALREQCLERIMGPVERCFSEGGPPPQPPQRRQRTPHGVDVMPLLDSISVVSQPPQLLGGKLAVPVTVHKPAPAGAVSIVDEGVLPHLMSSYSDSAARADTATVAVRPSPSEAITAGPAAAAAAVPPTPVLSPNASPAAATAAPSSTSLMITSEAPSVSAAREARSLLFERKRALRRLLKSVLTVSQPGPYSDEIVRRSRGYLTFPSPLFSSFVMRIFTLCKRSLSVPSFSRCQPGAQLQQLRNALQNSSSLRGQWHSLMLPVQHALTPLGVQALKETTIAYITLSAFRRFSRHQIDSMLTLQERTIGGVVRKDVAIADATAARVGAAVAAAAAAIRTAPSPLSTTPAWTIDQLPPAISATSARASAAAIGSAKFPSAVRATESEVSCGGGGGSSSDDEMLLMFFSNLEDDDSDDGVSAVDVEFEEDEYIYPDVDSLDYSDDEQ